LFLTSSGLEIWVVRNCFPISFKNNPTNRPLQLSLFGEIIFNHLSFSFCERMMQLFSLSISWNIEVWSWRFVRIGKQKNFPKFLLLHFGQDIIIYTQRLIGKSAFCSYLVEIEISKVIGKQFYIYTSKNWMLRFHFETHSNIKKIRAEIFMMQSKKKLV